MIVKRYDSLKQTNKIPQYQRTVKSKKILKMLSFPFLLISLPTDKNLKALLNLSLWTNTVKKLSQSTWLQKHNQKMITICGAED